MKKRERKFFSVFDVVIILIVIVMSAFALLSQFNNSDDELTCVIRVNGEIEHEVVLDSLDSATLVDVDGDYPLAVYVSQEGAYVSYSSCPDKLCEHTGKIDRASQSIVCLPAKVSITLESGDNTLDAVVG